MYQKVKRMMNEATISAAATSDMISPARQTLCLRSRKFMPSDSASSITETIRQGTAKADTATGAPMLATSEKRMRHSAPQTNTNTDSIKERTGRICFMRLLYYTVRVAVKSLPVVLDNGGDK